MFLHDNYHVITRKCHAMSFWHCNYDKWNENWNEMTIIERIISRFWKSGGSLTCSSVCPRCPWFRKHTKKSEESGSVQVRRSIILWFNLSFLRVSKATRPSSIHPSIPSSITHPFNQSIIHILFQVARTVSCFNSRLIRCRCASRRWAAAQSF